MADSHDPSDDPPPSPDDAATEYQGRTWSLAELEAMTKDAPPPDRTAFGQPAFVPLPEPTGDDRTAYGAPLAMAETAFAAPRPPLPAEATHHQATPTGAPSVDGPTAFAGPLAEAPTAFAGPLAEAPTAFAHPAVAPDRPISGVLPRAPAASSTAPPATAPSARPGRAGSLLAVVLAASTVGFLLGAVVALLT